MTQAANVADYAKLARAAIEEITARGRVPILAGGSGLYVRAALDDLDFPGTDWLIRSRLEDELTRFGPSALHARLAALDPAAAGAIWPSNGRRIVRALEVIEISGRPFTATMPTYQQNRPAVQIGLTLPRPELDRRIAARVDRMWQAGLEAEVRGLVAQGLCEGRTASRALGYQQLLRYLDGAVDPRRSPPGNDQGHQAVRSPPGILVPPRPPRHLARRHQPEPLLPEALRHAAPP